MRTAKMCVIGVVCLAVWGLACGAPADAARAGYMGITFDPAPLPALLLKHLRLEPGEGLRIVNVQVDSPADKAGLQRDDIIIGVGDDAVKDPAAFRETVSKAGAGNELTLKIIHLGRRKTVTLTLAEPAERPEDIKWKYPPEPEPIESWHPGRMWFMQPGDEDWNEVPWHQFFQAPGERHDIMNFFKERYTFELHRDGKSYSITIEGDPANDESWITVRGTEYKAMVKDIEELPEEYREAVRDALRRAQEQKARKPEVFKMPVLPKMPNLKREDIFKDLRQWQPPIPERRDDDKVLDKIQEQMRQLQKEIEKLQKKQQEMAEQLRRPGGSGV
ncbi:MAG TPA: PDZ domain-containing protein [Anaerohalosphaeraceae bacterium]|nr:PDZ domain-containing protein [Anaerohalosphaeraceae bacterium]HRT50581.1 PDZ domain-containing protein [Anaerohalosphaeraceae bacterium]HRT86479.1 PDZ domain-containing protein [Anaerohalosphaeraceae bacterium]